MSEKLINDDGITSLVNRIAAKVANKYATKAIATQSANGLMSAADKAKLDGIATGATNITIDSALSSTSTNPVQNKVVNGAIESLKTTATQSKNGLMSAGDKSKLDNIATGANNYVHPTTPGNKHIPAGGSSGQILKWSADGTAVWSVPIIPVLSSDPSNPAVGQIWIS